MTSQPSGELPTVSARTPVVRVGDYTLLSKLGEGGMGIVHLARRPDGQRVALKMLRPHVVGDDEARSRLAREVSSLERIRSRWVAEILDADPWADIPYVATRYVPGLSLHDHVPEEGPIEGHDLLWFAGCLAEGLASVHEVGVLHRDVKPSNVLMEGRTPILIDFGLARVADDPRLTHTGWLLGTPGYLAPEILYGEDATAASDLHSWAATVAFAATGRGPFGRGPAMAIMDRVRRGEHDLTGLDGPLLDVVVAALDPEPERRPTLEAVLEWLRPQTTRPTPLLAAPPATAPEPEPAPPASVPVEDVFTAPLAIAALGAAATTARVPADEPFDQEADDGWGESPTVSERVHTRVLPAQPQHAPPPYASRPPAAAVAPPAYAPPPAYAHPPAHPQAWDQPWDPAMMPPPVERVPPAERLRRGLLVAAGSVAVGAGFAAAPLVTLFLVTVAVWLLRSGSLAASAVSNRRRVRGTKWYDGAQLVVRTPWHLLQSIPGAAMLVLWSAGLGLAAALVCYAVAAGVPVTLFVSGLVLAGTMWWGPGGSRLRGPLSRVVAPVSRTFGSWVLSLGLVLALAVVLALLLQTNGVSWSPASEPGLTSYLE